MPYPSASPQADYAAAVEGLAERVLSALRGSRGGVVSAVYVGRADDVKTALAAARIVGPDLFAPSLLAGAPVEPTDLDAVAEAFRVFPPSPDDPPEAAHRDSVTAALLARYGGEVVYVATPPADDPEPTASWRAWSSRMALLSPLALPGVCDAVQHQACRRVRALGRGTVRSMLRRDYRTAARLARWLALAHSRGTSPDLDLLAVLTHVELCGGGGPRTTLDITIARCLMAGPRGWAA